MMNKTLISKRLKIALCYFSSEEGFVMPIAVGFGLVMLIIALTMIMRSQGDVVSASSQKNVSGALAAAETGVTRYQNFISRNKAIAVYPDCISRSANGTCADTGSSQKSWANATASLASELSGSSSSGSCGSTTTTSGNTTANTTTQIAQQSTTDWQDITEDITDASGVNQGQYKLVSYSGVPSNTAPGTATLTVLGRIKQSGANPATTKLVISIPVSSTTTPSTNPGTGTGQTGLWAKSFDFGGQGIANANVQDGSCGATAYTWTKDANGDYNRIGTVDDGDPNTANPKGTVTKSTQAFPDLPNGNVYPTTTTGIVNPITNIKITNNKDITFPSTGDSDTSGKKFGGNPSPPNNATYVYRITGDISLMGGNINFGSGSVSVPSQCNETIILYVDGDIKMTGTGVVKPTVCTNPARATKVVWYVNGAIKMAGSGLLYDPTYMQIYSYNKSASAVEVNGTGDLYGFIFAPFTETVNTGNGSIYGSLWTQSYRAVGKGNINQYPISNPPIPKPNTNTGSSQKINLGNVSSWERQSVN